MLSVHIFVVINNSFTEKKSTKTSSEFNESDRSRHKARLACLALIGCDQYQWPESFTHWTGSYSELDLWADTSAVLHN